MAPSTRYERISIASSDDLARIDPLIRAYVAQPSLALSVTEFVLNPDAWQEEIGLFSRFDDDDAGQDDDADAATQSTATVLGDQEPDQSADEDPPTGLEACVRHMDLGEKQTEMMLQSLDPLNHPQRPKPGMGRSKKRKLNHCNHPTAAVMLLLSLCKNITKLYAAAPLFEGWRGDTARTALQKYIRRSNYGLISKPILQKLECVEIIPSGTIAEDERQYIILAFLDFFQSFHRLPNLHSFLMDGVGEYQSEQRPLIPRTANVKVIHLGHSDMPVSQLCGVISAPKALEELKVSTGGLWSTDGGFPQLFMVQIGTALLEYRQTLKVLDLDLIASVHGNSDDDDSDGLWGQNERQHYGEEHIRLDNESSLPSTVTQEDLDKRKAERPATSFHDFTALTHLSIPIKALLKPRESGPAPSCRLMDTLPPGLEYLCLYSYTKGEDERLDSHVDELMENRAERFPKLVEIDGVEEPVINEWTDNPDEDELWEHPDKDLGWKKVAE